MGKRKRNLIEADGLALVAKYRASGMSQARFRSKSSIL